MPKRLTREEFIRRAIAKHGDKYGYDEVEYVNWNTKVRIYCKTCKEYFYQTPKNHLLYGCRKCACRMNGINQTKSREEFLERANKKHDYKYDYSKMDYVNEDTEITIICPKHGEFKQKPIKHLMGHGCPVCGRERINESKTKPLEYYLGKAREIYGDKYRYDGVVYVNSRLPVRIFCTDCQKWFEKTLNAHTNKYHPQGCPICGFKGRSIQNTLTTEEFIRRAIRRHGKRYDYSQTIYTGARNVVTIICREHGAFQQRPNDHLNGSGCPICGKTVSKIEDEIMRLLLSLKPQRHNHKILKRKEIDIYIPSHKLGVEYNGVEWHSEKYGRDKKYHLRKTEECNRQGIGLIQIFEDEWKLHKEICKNKLFEICGLSDNPEIYGDSCRIRETNKEQIREFLKKNDLEGVIPFTMGLGAYYGTELISVMVFRKEKEGFWRIERITTNIDYQCVGVEKRIFEYFIANYNFVRVRYFADRRWVANPYNNLYTQMGFVLKSFTEPSYTYHENGTGTKFKRSNKTLFTKKKLHEKYGFPMTMTEAEMAREIGVYRVWDCGKIEYVYVMEGNNI